MKGYQYLENDFFSLCQTRRIKKIPMLLYIYLRGLYCRFQNPDFFWKDEDTRNHLGITRNTLAKAKRYLQERGLIKFTSGTGKRSTAYTLFGTILLPDLRVSKKDTLGIKNAVLRYQSLTPATNRVKNRVKNRAGKFEIYNPQDENMKKLTKEFYAKCS